MFGRPVDNFLPVKPGKFSAPETRGNKINNELFKPDLTSGKPFGKPGYLLDIVEGQAGSGGYHHKTSALYQPVCTLCEAENTKVEYIGET